MGKISIDQLLTLFGYLEELQIFYGITTIEEVYEVLNETIDDFQGILN